MSTNKQISHGNSSIIGHEHAMSSPLFRSRFLDEAHELIAQNITPHKIEIKDDASNLDVNYRGIIEKDITLLNLNYGAHIELQPTGSNFYFTQTTMSGTSCLYSNRQIVPTRAGQTVVVSPCNEYKMDIASGTNRLVIGIEYEILNQYLSHLLQEELSEKLVFDVRVSDDNIQQIWVNHILSLSQVLASRPNMAKNNRLFRSQLESTLGLMLDLFPHNYTDALNNHSDSTTPKRIEKAKDYIRANIKSSITLKDVATAACISPRALQYSFREYVRQSPSEYIRTQKIAAVHEALLRADPYDNVTNILSDFNITNFGHFAKNYRAKYGKTPKETLTKRETSSLIFKTF